MKSNESKLAVILVALGVALILLLGFKLLSGGKPSAPGRADPASPAPSAPPSAARDSDRDDLFSDMDVSASAAAETGRDRVPSAEDGGPFPWRHRHGETNDWDAPLSPEAKALQAQLQEAVAGLSFRDRNAKLAELGRTYAREHPDLDIRGLRRFLRGLSREWVAEFLSGVFDVMLDSPPAAVVEGLLKDRRSYADVAMKVWATKDLPAALAFLGQSSDHRRAWLAAGAYAGWAEKDPRAAVAGALTSKANAFEQYSALSAALKTWAKDQPTEAWAFALTLEGQTPDARRRLLTDVCAVYAAQNLPAALDALKTQYPASDRQWTNQLTSLSYSLARLEPSAAAALLDGESWLKGQERIVWWVTRNWSEQNPRAAAAWVPTLGNETLQFDAARQLASRWATADYDGAFDWAYQLPEGLMRAGALSNVANRQAALYADKPVDWMKKLPPSYSRDRSIAGYVLGRLQAVNDPNAAQRVRQQLEKNPIDLPALSRIVEQSKAPANEKSSLNSLITLVSPYVIKM